MPSPTRSPQPAAGAGSDEPDGRTDRVSRIAVGVDGYPEGRDAVTLGRAIAEATGAELMLVAVHLDPLVVLPNGLGYTSLRKEAVERLRSARDSLAPDAQIVAETDLSIPRALHRVVRREHRDLLVVGSSRHAAPGHVRIGKRTRQLLCHFECALAIAPRGMRARPPALLRKIGVGYDGGPESDAAVALATTIANGAGAELRICSVVDDRVPVLLRSPLGELIAMEWAEAISEEERRLRVQAVRAAAALEGTPTPEVHRGRPADALLAFSGDVDLLVIGSRRWGPVARVLLGSTGEALLHDAACPVVAVPRPVS